MGWKDWFMRKEAKDIVSQFEADPELPELRGTSDIRLLERELGSPNVLARIAAIQALADVSDPAALRLVSQATKDAWRAVRIVAAESTAKLMGAGIAITDVGSISEELVTARRRVAASLPPESFARYVKGLRHPDSAIRLAAAEVLGETATAAAGAPLVTALGDPDMSVVSQATESLVQLGEVALLALSEGSRSRNTMVRDSSKWCLQQIAKSHGR
jgi:HEAT repeat protein